MVVEIFPQILIIHLSVNYVTSFEFHQSGETIATMDSVGNCLISEVSTDNTNCFVSIGKLGD